MIVRRAVAYGRRIESCYAELQGGGGRSDTISLPTGSHIELVVEPCHRPGPGVVLIVEAAGRHARETGLLVVVHNHLRIDVIEGVVAKAQLEVIGMDYAQLHGISSG